MQLKSIWIKRLIGWGLVVGILGLIFEPHGYLAVKYACAKDGGLYLPERLKTDSLYQSYNARETYCLTCLIGIKRGWFEFAENRVTKPNKFEPEPGIYRYSVSTMGDPSCAAWLKDHKGLSDLPEGQCMAIELVDEPVSPYKYSYEVDDVRGMLLAKIRRTRYTVIDRATGELAASMVRYAYASWGMFPDSTSFRWYCEGQPEAYTDTVFLKTILDIGD